MDSSRYSALMVKSPPGVDDLPLRAWNLTKAIVDLINENDPTPLWLVKAETHHKADGCTQLHLAVYTGGPEALWVLWDCNSKKLRLVEFEDKDGDWNPVDCVVFHYDQDGWKPELDMDYTGLAGQGISYGHCKFILEDMQKMITFPKGPTRILVTGEATWEV